MSLDGDQDRASYYYRRWETWLHLVLVVVVATCLALLFSAKALAAPTIIGITLLPFALALLILLAVASDLWFPRVPDDVWREAHGDVEFRQCASEIDITFRALSEQGAGPTDIQLGMKIPIEEAINTYRRRYPYRLVRRGIRRLVILACIVLTFASAARVLVLVDHGGHVYKHLSTHSNIVDYAYFSFIAVSTVGYGDITPLTIVARTLSIAFGAITIVYLLMIINYVWIHEARRESLLAEYLKKRYL